jgi:hypothetical protein
MCRFDYNILRAATFWVLSWASVCLLILEISSSGLFLFFSFDIVIVWFVFLCRFFLIWSGNTNQTSASILFYIGSPIVVLCCVVGMRFVDQCRLNQFAFQFPSTFLVFFRFRKTSITRRALADIHSPSEIELKVAAHSLMLCVHPYSSGAAVVRCASCWNLSLPRVVCAVSAMPWV